MATCGAGPHDEERRSWSLSIWVPSHKGGVKQIMRIAMVSHSNSPWAEPYARHFQKAGHDVLMVSMHPDKIDGVEIVSVGRDRFDIGRGKGLFFLRVPRIRRILKEYAPQVVFATYLISNGLTSAMAWRGPLVVSARGTDGVERLCAQGIPRWMARRMIRWTCKRADLVHAVSEQWRREVIGLGVPKEKTFVVPLGVDTDQFAPAGHAVQSDPLHIVCVRKHEAIYRIDVIIKSLAELKTRGMAFRATFAGEGRLLDDHKRLVNSRHLADRIRFTGDLPRSGVADLLRTADVYISAAVSDGTASSLLEAMSVGAFPVISRIEANRDWIEDGVTGLFFDTDSVASTTEAIACALNDPALRRQSREINRNRIVAEADYKVTMKALISRLEEVAGKYANVA